jgi:hypothetical protein
MKSLSCKHNRKRWGAFSNVGKSSLITQVLSDPLEQTTQCKPVFLNPWLFYTGAQLSVCVFVRVRFCRVRIYDCAFVCAELSCALLSGALLSGHRPKHLYVYAIT